MDDQELFDRIQGPNGEYRFAFLERGDTIETTNLLDIDELLVATFKARVDELT